MSKITFFDEGGNNVTEEIVDEVLSRNVAFWVDKPSGEVRLPPSIVDTNVGFQDVGAEGVVDNTESVQVFRPTLTQRIELDEKGKESQTTTVCGETENRREGSNLPEMTVEGIIIQEQISEIRSLQARDDVTLVSDIYKGPIYVKRVTIEQNSNLLYWIENGEKSLAFNFQIQLGKPEN